MLKKIRMTANFLSNRFADEFKNNPGRVFTEQETALRQTGLFLHDLADSMEKMK